MTNKLSSEELDMQLDIAGIVLKACEPGGVQADYDAKAQAYAGNLARLVVLLVTEVRELREKMADATSHILSLNGAFSAAENERDESRDELLRTRAERDQLQGRLEEARERADAAERDE